MIDWHNIEQQQSVTQLDRHLKEVSHVFGPHQWIRPVGKPIEIQRYWDAMNHKFGVVRENTVTPPGCSIKTRLVVWSFIRGIQPTVGSLPIPMVVEIPRTVARMINNERKRLGIDPCDIDGLMFEITKTGQGMTTRYNVNQTVPDKLQTQEIDIVNGLVPLQILYFGDIRGDIPKQQTVAAKIYTAECPQCDGNGYLIRDSIANKCERCGGEGTLHF